MFIDQHDFFSESIEGIAKKARKYTCQLFKHDKHGIIQAFGSGVFFQFNENYFLFSASHVLIDSADIYIATEEKMIKLNGDMLRSLIGEERSVGVNTFDIDHGVVRLMREEVEEIIKSYCFLLLEDIVLNNIPQRRDEYFIFGYPKTRTKSNYNNKSEIISSPLYFLSREVENEVYKRKKIDERGQLLIEYPKKMHSIASGQRMKLPAVEGMSGCGLWRLREIYDDGSSGNIVRLAGIVSEYNVKGDSVIISSRMELLINVIREGFGIEQLPSFKNIKMIKK